MVKNWKITKNLFTSCPGINYFSKPLLNLKRISIRENTDIADIQRYCDYNIKRELVREAIFQIPRWTLGMKRYSLLRRIIIGEKSDSINQVFEP